MIEEASEPFFLLETAQKSSVPWSWKQKIYMHHQIHGTCNSLMMLHSQHGRFQIKFQQLQERPYDILGPVQSLFFHPQQSLWVWEGFTQKKQSRGYLPLKTPPSYIMGDFHCCCRFRACPVRQCCFQKLPFYVIRVHVSENRFFFPPFILQIKLWWLASVFWAPIQTRCGRKHMGTGVSRPSSALWTCIGQWAWANSAFSIKERSGENLRGAQSGVSARKPAANSHLSPPKVGRKKWPWISRWNQTGLFQQITVIKTAK